MADFQGRGKFVGLFLGVTGEDNSWWILEGDENMTVDGESRPPGTAPDWKTTSMEVGITGAQPSQRSATSWTGHLSASRSTGIIVDPVNFSKSFHMEMSAAFDPSSGAEECSRAISKVAFAYIDHPSAVEPVPTIAHSAARRGSLRPANHDAAAF